MFIINHSDNTTTSISSMTNASANFPKANILTEFSGEVAKAISNTTTITFTSTFQDIFIFNTNANNLQITAGDISETLTTKQFNYFFRGSSNTSRSTTLTLSTDEDILEIGTIVTGVAKQFGYTTSLTKGSGMTVLQTSADFEQLSYITRYRPKIAVVSDVNGVNTGRFSHYGYLYLEGISLNNGRFFNNDLYGETSIKLEKV
jgi:prophage tail gpP-like protein